MKRRSESPGPDAPCNAFVCTIGVDDLDATLARAKGLGAKQVVDTMELPKVGRFAYIHDTEGNIVGVIQPAPM